MDKRKQNKHEQRQQILAWTIMVLAFICIISYGITNYVDALSTIGG